MRAALLRARAESEARGPERSDRRRVLSRKRHDSRPGHRRLGLHRLARGRQAADAGLEPRIFDLRPSPHHEPGAVDTVIGDLLDARDPRAAMEDCDAVIHLAAVADVGIVAEQPADAERCNARGTLAVLEAARATGTRVVYGSTIWVYGDSGDGR